MTRSTTRQRLSFGEEYTMSASTFKPRTNESKITATDAIAPQLSPHVSALNARAERALRHQFDNMAEEKRKAPNWARFVGTKGEFLNREDQEVITLYERQPNDSVQELLDTENNGEQYAFALFKALKNITETKVTEYVLELIEDFLAPDFCGRIVYFEQNGHLPDLSPLIRNLESDSQFIRDRTSSLLALILSIEAEKEQDSLDAYITWSCEQLRAHKGNPNHSSVRAAVFSLSIALSHPHIRLCFHKHGGTKFLLLYLNSAASKHSPSATGMNTQLVYEVTLCLWLMSLTSEAVADFGFQCVMDLSQLISDNRKEKIVRVALATLRSIVLSQPAREKELGEWLSASELNKTLEQLQITRINDPDVLSDVETLRHKANNYRELTSFELYQHEVHSGTLKWGACHQEKFWKENVKFTEKEDFKTIKELIALLDKPKEDPEDLTLAIACSDLGYFCQYFPNGRAILSTLGAKSKVMGLLEHRDRDVQKAALVCVSKMLVTQWEFLNFS